MPEPKKSENFGDGRAKPVGRELRLDNADLYRTLFDRDQRAIAVLEGETVIECNAAMLELYGGTKADYIGKTPWEITPVREFDGSPAESASREYVREAYQQGSVQFDWVHQRPDGSELSLDVSLTRIELPKGRGVVVSIDDITEIHLAEHRLRKQIDFQARLAEISNSFTTGGQEDTDNRITEILRQIGESYDLDRVRLWWDRPDSGTGHCSHDWARDGDSSRGRAIKLDTVSWSEALLQQGKDFCFSSVNELPDEAASDRAFCIAEGVESLLVVPVLLEEHLVAGASFSTTRKAREWPQRVREELRLLAQVVAGAWRHDQYIRELNEREEDLVRSQQVAEVGSISEIALPGKSLLDGWGTSKFSDQACAIFGIERGTESVELALSRIHPDDRDAILRAGREAVRNKTNYISEYRVNRPDGTTVHVEERAHTECDEAGHVVRWIGTVQDVTVRREHELRMVETLRRLEEREAELSRLQRVAEIGSYSETARPGETLSQDSFGTYKLSGKACEIYGIEPGTETVELVIARVHPEDRLLFNEPLLPGGSADESQLQDYRVVRPDGSTVYVQDRWATDLNEDGEIVRIVGTVMDVTARVKSKSRLQKALVEIEQLKEKLEDENLYLKREVRTARRPDKIVGNDPQLLSALASAGRVAPTDVTVLILGETGTGKELIAREIHELSDRSEMPLVSVNCAALSVELIESELFGHESGAYTGAQKQRKGRFEIADNGTLFLDEIGDLSAAVQAKILRVLQSGEFERLGGTETLQVDVRLIAATHRDLQQMVDCGEFRSDLLYRINGFPIVLPPLRDRRDDIALLANFLVEKHAGHLGKNIESITPDMIVRLRQMNWPGNIRELESYLQRALIAATGPVLDYTEADTADDQLVSMADLPSLPVDGKLDAVQREHIVRRLELCNWVIGGKNGAASSLGMPASTLRSKMKRLGITRKS